MSEIDPKSQADLWEAEYLEATELLRQRLNGVDGPEVALTIERWEEEYWNHPRIAAAVRSHAMIAHMTLLKTPTNNININVGDNSNLQIGSNVSNAEGSIAAGNSNQVITDSQVSTGHLPVESNAEKYANIAVGVIAGLLAGWWCLPQWASLGPARLTLTVVLVVASMVMSILNWFQFRRRNWEKFAYIGLGTILILHSAIPSFVGGGAASGKVDAGNASGEVAGYVTFADEPLYAIIEVALGVIVLYFGFRTKTTTD